MFSRRISGLVVLLSLVSFFFAANAARAATDEIAELVETAKKGKDFADREDAVNQLLALEDEQALYGLIEVAQYHIALNGAVVTAIDHPEASIGRKIVKRALKIVEPGLAAILTRFNTATLTRDETATVSGLGLLWELILDKDMPQSYRERATTRFLEELNERGPGSSVVQEWARRIRQQVNNDLVAMVNLAIGDAAELDLRSYENANNFERLAYFNRCLTEPFVSQFYEITESQKRLAVDVSFIVLSRETDHFTEFHAELFVIQFGTAEDLERLIGQTENDWIRRRAAEQLAEEVEEEE